MNSRQVNQAFRKVWHARCTQVPAYANDPPAKRQAFQVFIEGLWSEGRISDRVLNNVTLEGDK